jgi:quercetin dioxygenase-like cupin family protein
MKNLLDGPQGLGHSARGSWRTLLFFRNSRPSPIAAGGGHPGALWRLDGEELQANLVRLDRGDRISPHSNDEVEVLVVVVFGRGALTLDGQLHPLAPMVVAHLPKGTVRAIAAVDGPLAYLSVHRRRPAGLQVGRPVQRR